MSTPPTVRYEPIAVTSESTVVAEFEPTPTSSSAYQSEAALEAELIRMLGEQAYQHLTIHTETDLVANLRTQLEALNAMTFSDTEWERFFRECIARPNEDVADKTVRVQEDHVQVLTRDDGTTKNVKLVDKANVHNNRLQVINQYEVAGARQNRYDVTILVNGLPMVHVELKRRGVRIRDAFNQISRYQRDSFWAGSGLFGYVQLFVISNGTNTKYYSNTTRYQHVDEQRGSKRSGKAKTSDSFEFTSWWADARNRRIEDLTDFTRTFFSKHTLLNVLTRYCVLTADCKLLVMRPYQIVAAEQILLRVQSAGNRGKLGSVDAGGYVWHTTGSGKTLTSFKASQLAARLDDVDRVLFVVDRKDLDYQTIKEYERFAPGSVNTNRNTDQLSKQLTAPVGTVLGQRGTETIVNRKIVVTTIQKLARFIAANPKHPIYDARVVITFDECHRSQFGTMHTAITKAFKRYHLFGFTGTPIFAKNAPAGGSPTLKTTEQAFGDKLHTYTIVDAINDGNVLPFRIDYINTIKIPDQVADKQVAAIDKESAYLASERVRQVVEYILEHFDRKTKRAQHYMLKDRRVHGFNALFATSSIEAARIYYNQFFLQQEQIPAAQRLKVGLIYSYAANEEDVDGLLGEEEFETDALGADARSFLEAAIADYNAMFGTSWDTSADKFQSYYKDLSERIRNREIDLVIVVNMFLTGFDATTLNTLWVDKNLRSHGLIQAFSRTNRILNSVKTFGNIVSFRNLEDETKDALALFGNNEAAGVVLLKPFEHYYTDYTAKVADLLARFPLGQQLLGEQAKKDFVALFGVILRLRNILTAFDDFDGNEILTDRQVQDYTSRYLDLYADFRAQRDADKEPIADDLVFEIELIKQVEVNVDYILELVRQHRADHPSDDTEMRTAVERAIDSSPSLRNKKDLIEEFVASLTARSDVDTEWERFVTARREAELAALIASENLDPAATHAFVRSAFRDGAIQETGTAITKLLPPVSRFDRAGAHAAKKQAVLDKLAAFVERFLGLAG